MARIFVTGSTDGLGLATATSLLEKGHEIIVHSRNHQRLTAVQHLIDKGAKPVVGDLAIFEQQCAIAEQVNQFGQMDAVIHNAGMLSGKEMLAVNVLAPYVLTALITKPSRLIYLSSSMHFSGITSLSNIKWQGSLYSYSDSKLFVTTMANAIAQRWQEVSCFVVDPGWVPTKMGGKNATDDFFEGYQTQAWLAEAEKAASLESGTYWHHKQTLAPHKAAQDEAFQQALLTTLKSVTGVSLP